MCFQPESENSPVKKPHQNGKAGRLSRSASTDGDALNSPSLGLGFWAQHLASQPNLEHAPVVAFRANGLYEFVMRRVQQELERCAPGARINLCIAPPKSSQPDIRELLQASLQCVNSGLMLSDRTTERAITKVTPFLQSRSLDDVFGSAAGAVLLERFGASFFNSPNDCAGDTVKEREENFLKELKAVLPKILKLGFAPLIKAPNHQVVIFTEELSSHAPFYYVEKLGLAPGELLKDSLVQLGIAAERITVVANPQQLLQWDDRGDDPFLNICQASSVVFLGDRHRVSPAWIRDGIIRGLNLSLDEELAVAQKLFGVRRGAELTKLERRAQPEVDPDFVDAVVELLRGFGLGNQGSHGAPRAVCLQLPLENFLMDISRHKLLDPASAVDPETLVPLVTQELLSMLKAPKRVSN